MGLDTYIFHQVRRKNSKDEIEVVEKKELQYYRKNWFWVWHMDAENCEEKILTDELIDSALDLLEKLQKKSVKKIIASKAWADSGCVDSNNVKESIADYIKTLNKVKQLMHSEEWDPMDQIVLYNWW